MNCLFSAPTPRINLINVIKIIRRNLVVTLNWVFVTCISTREAFAQGRVNTGESIQYCASQANKALLLIPKNSEQDLPRNINSGKKDWRYVTYRDWCSGFWPGELWYLYEGTRDKKWAVQADKFTRQLSLLSSTSGFDHDLGFQLFNSFGNGYRLTGNAAYKKIILRASDSLATLYNPKVGTILSWPNMVNEKGWPHNTIIDNMINLEMLFWASKNGGKKAFYDIALSHARTTMKNHFRPDYSAYHVVVYDTVTGNKIKGVTHQGFSDSSTWARGQSWAIYGFTMCYRETIDREFLKFAQKVADLYLKRLPEDLIPYWDFDSPEIPNVPKDASAAAVTASALLELSTFVPKKKKSNYYRAKAEAILAKLSTPEYQSRNVNSAALLHSTGHKPNGTEIDASIIYADYYYTEALVRLKKLQAGKKLTQNF